MDPTNNNMPTPPDSTNSPAVPNEPITPNTPIASGSPVTPDAPIAPDVPVTPSNPVEPNAPIAPNTPAIESNPIVSSGPSLPNNPVVPSEPITPTGFDDMGQKKNKKNMIIAIAIAGVVVLGGIIALIALLSRSSVDYAKLKENVSVFFEDLSNYMDRSNCSRVNSNFSDTYATSVEAYNSYIEDCKTDSKEINEALNKFESENNLSGDSELKSLFDKFKASFNENAPSSDKLESTLKAYEAVHNYLASVRKLDLYGDKAASVEDFSKAADYLINSGNESLSAYGNDLVQQYTNLSSLYQEYQTAREAFLNNPSDDAQQSSAAFEAYSNALSDFKYDNYEKLKLSNNGVHLTDSSDSGNGSIYNTFEDFINYISKNSK